jgi:hypothetical protein
MPNTKAEHEKLTQISQVMNDLSQSKSPTTISELSKTLEGHILDLKQIRSSM